jgi:hypothetical protein
MWIRSVLNFNTIFSIKLYLIIKNFAFIFAPLYQNASDLILIDNIEFYQPPTLHVLA